MLRLLSSARIRGLIWLAEPGLILGRIDAVGVRRLAGPFVPDRPHDGDGFRRDQGRLGMLVRAARVLMREQRRAVRRRRGQRNCRRGSQSREESAGFEEFDAERRCALVPKALGRSRPHADTLPG
jgi:hypothetical protein